jgi:hypothetical protein
MFDQCVRSLLLQDYQGHIEVMCVVDHDPGQSSDAQSDLNIAKALQFLASSGGYAGLRSIRIKRGPGRSNWRPGAIHFPVFEHWLQTKCDYVSYQFSDEWSGPTRFSTMIRDMQGNSQKAPNCLWGYCYSINIVNGAGNLIRRQDYPYEVARVPTNQLMTPSILVHRNSFEAVGGLDFPLHAAAKAEEWIQTHCAFIGVYPRAVRGQDMYYFREHEESLGHGQKPQSKVYHEAIAETGWVEEDHWRLWDRILPLYNERIEKWRRG